MQPCKLRRSRKPCWRSARPRTAATLARSARHRANPQVKLNDHIGLWFCDRHIATARPNLWSLLAIPSPRDDVVARRQVRRNLHLVNNVERGEHFRNLHHLHCLTLNRISVCFGKWENTMPNAEAKYTRNLWLELRFVTRAIHPSMVVRLAMLGATISPSASWDWALRPHRTRRVRSL